MKINKRFILSFVAPFMILMSAIGVIFRDNDRKIFYLPIGLMGISILLEKELRRRFDRENIWSSFCSLKGIRKETSDEKRISISGNLNFMFQYEKQEFPQQGIAFEPTKST